MAVTPAGSPYVESSDLVANYPGVSLALAERVDQVVQAPTQNAITATTYQPVALDAGKTVTLNNASAVTLTIPAQATVAWAANTQLNFLNIGAGTVTITPAADVTINGTPLTLATSKGGSLVRTASNTWTFIPFSAGSDSPVINEGASTNVTFSTLINPDGDGKNYRLANWNSTGTLVVTTAGAAQGLIVDGGNSGLGASNSTSAGGKGGDIRVISNLILAASTITMTVGLGGVAVTAASAVGGASSLGSLTTANPVARSLVFANGASLTGGLGGAATFAGATGVLSNVPGSDVRFGGGGGGGQGGGSNGGPGGGGSGEFSVNTNNGTPGDPNTGGGGGGRWSAATTLGYSGGSGRVAVRWEI